MDRFTNREAEVPILSGCNVEGGFGMEVQIERNKKLSQRHRCAVRHAEKEGRGNVRIIEERYRSMLY